MQIHEKTLPIVTQDGLSLNTELAQGLGTSLSTAYSSAEPFPHIVIDNFLPNELIEEILSNFPSDPTANEKLYERGYRGHHKRQINPNECNAFVRKVFAFFNSAPMLQFMEKLTSIDGLIPDPYFNGGGFHEIGTGGLLGVHSDFRINKTLHVERRLNAIIYLNKDWKDEYGGNLELWDKQMKRCIKKIPPIFNRCVVFNTDQDSNHGHPEPLNTPPDIKRRSIALYYYTASKKLYDDIDTHRTLYKRRPGDKIEWRKVLGRLLGRKVDRD
jgi:Rps23 Pro-64 3,4-dihydroxylase Tpa1-like proline 4-hydroxylase